jgi:hypothetical protein
MLDGTAGVAGLRLNHSRTNGRAPRANKASQITFGPLLIERDPKVREAQSFFPRLFNRVGSTIRRLWRLVIQRPEHPSPPSTPAVNIDIETLPTPLVNINIGGPRKSRIEIKPLKKSEERPPSHARFRTCIANTLPEYLQNRKYSESQSGSRQLAKLMEQYLPDRECSESQPVSEHLAELIEHIVANFLTDFDMQYDKIGQDPTLRFDLQVLLDKALDSVELRNDRYHEDFTQFFVPLYTLLKSDIKIAIAKKFQEPGRVFQRSVSQHSCIDPSDAVVSKVQTSATFDPRTSSDKHPDIHSQELK